MCSSPASLSPVWIRPLSPETPAAGSDPCSLQGQTLLKRLRVSDLKTQVNFRG